MLEDECQRVFQCLEDNDVILIPSIGSSVVTRFLLKVSDTMTLKVSDDVRCSLWFKDLPYYDTIYNSRFPAQLSSGSAWVTYDVALHYLANDRQELERFDFIQLDGVDDRTLNSDMFMAFISEVKLQTKLVIPLRSSFQVSKYKDFFARIGYVTSTLDLIGQPSIETYFAANGSLKLDIECMNVVKQLLEMDHEELDILIVTSSRFEVARLSHVIRDSMPQGRFSLLTDLKEYTIKGHSKRIIISSDSHFFLDNNHRVKYIVDYGLITVRKTDPNGIDYEQVHITNNNRIQQHISILRMEGSKYFNLQQRDSVSDWFLAIRHRSLIPYILMSIKLNVKFTELRFLSPPETDSFTNCLNQMCYLGLIRITGDGYTSTELAQRLTKLQFSSHLPRISLLLSLLHSSSFNCVGELLSITSILIAMDPNALANFISQDSFDRSMVSEQSDFFTLINAYNCLIKQGVKRTLKKDPFTKEDKREIRHVYNCLHNALGIKTPKDHRANEDDIQRALILGFQFQSALLQKSVDSLTHKQQALLSPVWNFHDTDMSILLKKPLDHLDDCMDAGDLFIFADYDFDTSTSGIKAYASISAKCNRRIALETTKVFKVI